MHAQVYSVVSGTKRFKCHANKYCSSQILSSISTNASDPTQATLNQTGFKRSPQFSDKDIKAMKSLCVEWICGDIRPFSILDDPGFRNIAQKYVRLGKRSLIFIVCVNFLCFCIFLRFCTW